MSNGIWLKKNVYNVIEECIAREDTNETKKIANDKINLFTDESIRKELIFLNSKLVFKNNGIVNMFEKGGTIHSLLNMDGNRMIAVIMSVANRKKLYDLLNMKRYGILHDIIIPTREREISGEIPILKSDIRYMDMLVRLLFYELFSNFERSRFLKYSPWLNTDIHEEWRKQGQLISTKFIELHRIENSYDFADWMKKTPEGMNQKREASVYSEKHASAIFAADLSLLHINSTNNNENTQSIEDVSKNLKIDIEFENFQNASYEFFRKSIIDTFPRYGSDYKSVEQGGGGMCFFHSLWHQLCGHLDDGQFFTNPKYIESCPNILKVRMVDGKEKMNEKIKFLQKLYLRDMSFVKFVEFSMSDNMDKFQTCITGMSAKTSELAEEFATMMPNNKSVQDKILALLKWYEPIDLASLKRIIHTWYNGLNLDELEVHPREISKDMPEQGTFIYKPKHINSMTAYHDNTILIALSLIDSDRDSEYEIKKHELGLSSYKDIDAIIEKGRRLINTGMTELCYTGSYVGANHLLAVSEALKLNIFVYHEKGTRQPLMPRPFKYYSVTENAWINCFLEFSGRDFIDGHYTSIQLVDEEASYRKIRHPIGPHITDLVRLTQRACMLFVTGDNKSVDDILFMSASMSYFRAPESGPVFFEVFYKLLTRTGNGCLLDKVRLLHKIVHNLISTPRKSEDRTGELVPILEEKEGSVEGYDIIDLPIEFGFKRTENSKFKPARHGLLLKKTNPNHARTVSYLRNFIFSVLTELQHCMYMAVVLTVYFIYIPSVAPATGNGMDFINGIQSCITENTDTNDVSNLYHMFETFYEKVIMYGIPLSKENLPCIINVCKSVILHKPQLLKYSAFWEFYSVVMYCMFEAIYSTSVKKLINLETSRIASKLISPAAAGEKIGVHSMSIGVRISSILDKGLVLSSLKTSKCNVLVWLTSGKTVIQREYERRGRIDDNDDKVTTIEKFMHGARISFAELDLADLDRVVDIPFEFERKETESGDNKGMYMHFAVLIKRRCQEVSSQSFDIRHGHAFIEYDSIPRHTDFRVTTWEGPVATDISLDTDEMHGISRGMKFKPTFALDVVLREGSRVDDTQGMLHFCKDAPSTLFSKEQMSVVSRFLLDMTRSFDSHVVSMHSLLYINFPIQNNVIPLWSVMFLPPMDTKVEVLQNRVDAVLFYEDITLHDFLNIAITAFKDVMITDDDQKAWMPGHNFKVNETLREFARYRFIWIFTQIVNPFNKIIYKPDVFDNKTTEQMNYPTCGFGDCEDTCEGVVRFLRGIQKIDIDSLRIDKPAVYCVLKFLSFYSPCMCVLTTNGASFTNKQVSVGAEAAEDSEFYSENTHVDLHMMCLLVPRHLISSKKYTKVMRDACIPVETTGFNFNSYATSEQLLDGATTANASPILKSASEYAKVCEIALMNKDVEKEIISYANLVTSPEEQGWSFITPKHYFYGRFISACHDLDDSSDGRFLDFFYSKQDKLKPGVRFHDVINPRADTSWKFSAPTAFVKDPRIDRKSVV